MNIAVDIIFSFPDFLTEEIISISEKIQEHSKEKIHLGFEKNIPHISLWMGIIPVSKLDELHQEIYRLSLKKRIPTLKATKITQDKNTPNSLFSIEIEKSELLLSWHNEICKIANTYRSNSLPKQDHFSENRIQMAAINYVKNFNELHSGKAYNPHITLGFGKNTATINKAYFEAKSLAIYQLGNYCSCHKMLKKIPFHLGYK